MCHMSSMVLITKDETVVVLLTFALLIGCSTSAVCISISHMIFNSKVWRCPVLDRSPILKPMMFCHAGLQSDGPWLSVLHWSLILNSCLFFNPMIVIIVSVFIVWWQKIHWWCAKKVSYMMIIQQYWSPFACTHALTVN